LVSGPVDRLIQVADSSARLLCWSVLGDPLSGVVRDHAQVVGEDLGGDGGRGQPDDGAGSMFGFPHGADAGRRGCLAGAAGPTSTTTTRPEVLRCV
jgi:hypothetical protein